MTATDMTSRVEHWASEGGVMYAATLIVLITFALAIMIGVPWYIRKKTALEEERRKEDKQLLASIVENNVLSRKAIEESSDVMKWTRALHEAMEETDKNRHDVVVDKLDIAVTEIREIREMHKELDSKTTLKLERIERALTAEIDGRQKGEEQ